MPTTIHTYLKTKIVSIQSRIDLFEQAESDLAVGNIQSYMLDTGQTIQKVTKLEIEFLRSHIESLYNQLDVLDARVNRTGSKVMRPGW